MVAPAATMPRSIIQTSLAFTTRVVLRFHLIQEGESFGRRVLKDGNVVRLVEGERASAQEAPLLVSEARQLVENFGRLMATNNTRRDRRFNCRVRAAAGLAVQAFVAARWGSSVT